MTTYYIDGAVGSDSNAGTSEGSGNAWATFGKAASVAVDGDLVHAKDSATYTLTSAVAWGTAGVTVRGYHATPGDDAGRPLITCSTNSVNLFSVNADRLTFRHLKFTHTAGTRGQAFVPKTGDRSQCAFIDLVIDGTSKGIDGEWTVDYTLLDLLMSRCEVKNCTSFGASFVSGVIEHCYIHDNGGDGWNHAQTGSAISFNIVGSTFANNGGKNISWDRNMGYVLAIRDTIVRGATSHGIYVNANASTMALVVENCVIELNGGYGINSANALAYAVQKNNAFRSNTSGNRNTNVPAGEGDITLTGDPFVNASGGDYSLDNTAGEGAALRSAGFPGVAPFGTGYRDVGPLQHQDAGGGTSYFFMVEG